MAERYIACSLSTHCTRVQIQVVTVVRSVILLYTVSKIRGYRVGQNDHIEERPRGKRPLGLGLERQSLGLDLGLNKKVLVTGLVRLMFILRVCRADRIRYILLNVASRIAISNTTFICSLALL